jgi:large subunit ribosomal protein L24
MRIKKNDNVAVIAGKDKGKSGLVERVFPKENKLVVKGIAIAKKSVKPSRKAPQGGIIEINQKIDASDVMMICPACGKLTKVEYKVTEKGKTRVCKKCNQSLEGGNR